MINGNGIYYFLNLTQRIMMTYCIYVYRLGSMLKITPVVIKIKTKIIILFQFGD